MAKKIPPRKTSALFIDPAIPRSKAWRSLTGTSIKVLFEFYLRRQFVKRKRIREGEDPYDIVNNGEIVFTYTEAVKKRGFSRATFQRSLAQLVAVGFIDVAQSGGGMYKSPNLYALSKRWKFYGTPKFEEGVRPKPPKLGRHPGFRAGHPSFSTKKKTSIKNDNVDTVIKNEHLVTKNDNV